VRKKLIKNSKKTPKSEKYNQAVKNEDDREH